MFSSELERDEQKLFSSMLNDVCKVIKCEWLTEYNSGCEFGLGYVKSVVDLWETPIEVYDSELDEEEASDNIWTISVMITEDNLELVIDNFDIVAGDKTKGKTVSKTYKLTPLLIEHFKRINEKRVKDLPLSLFHELPRIERDDE